MKKNFEAGQPIFIFETQTYKRQSKLMPDFDEKKIIEGCLKNDRKAQKALYDQYKTKMYTLAYRITNNFEDAADVLQEGFLQVFNSLPTFNGNSKIGTWIHTIIARAALKKVKEQVYLEEISEINHNILINWGSDIDVQKLEKAISELPTGYRSIFTLYEVEGFKHREIAEMMDISVSTSKTQLLKAKRMLVNKLNNGK